MLDESDNLPQSYRVTTKGVYHISRIIKKFTYLDAVVVDTPILDSEIRDTISDVEVIGERLDRAEIFCGYLDNQWQSIVTDNVGFKWSEISRDLRNDFFRIRSKIAIHNVQRPN